MKLYLAILLCCTFTAATFAEPVELAYDNGRRGGHFDQANPGDIEAVRFTPAHPCSLLSFRYMVTGPEQMEWHVWADNGGNMPDVNNDLMEPMTVEPGAVNAWATIDLSDRNIVFDIPKHFHIGYVKLAADPDLWVDGGNPVEQRSSIKIGSDWYVTGEGSGNFLVRATVEYYDERDQFQFTDATREAGVRQFSKVAWGDYDNDDWEDLLLDGRTLFHNDGDGTFSDVSTAAGLVEGNNSSGGCWGDFDNDGWLDLFGISHDMNGPDRLYHNNGDGTFTFANDLYSFYNGADPTEACGWGDANNDGYLELYIANSEQWIDDAHQNYFPDYFWTYSADFEMFVEQTATTDIQNLRRYGRGVAWCDFNNDGLMDIYISNYRLHPNFFLVNQGGLNFENQARSRGIEGSGRQGMYGHTIGSSWADYDNDGDFDLFVGNLAHPRFLSFSDKCMLYRNNGAPNWNFTDVRDSAGIAYDETASSPAWGDFDNDGWQDLFVTSVYEGRQPYLYRNNGDGTFTNSNYPAGFHTKAYNSWGAAWCDYDHDGDLDLAVGGNHGGLFRNNGDDENNAWIEIALKGTTANSFGFGSRVKVWEHGEQLQMRQVEGGMGTGASQNMMAVHFGLGPRHRSLVDIEIDWLGGETERIENVVTDRRYIAVQGEGLLAVKKELEIWNLEFGIGNAYPNPFNSTVTISYQLSSSSSSSSLAIYDLSGRLIATLVSGTQTAGAHKVVWDGGGAPAGIYIARLEAGGKVANVKLVLVK